jgi:hypothetical protein
MKLIAVVLLFFLIGCAPRPPYEELVANAELTNDWSEVEKYKRMNKSMRRVDVDADHCKNGHILVCHTESGNEFCGCVSPIDSGLRQ